MGFDQPVGSIADKYRWQVDSYQAILDAPLGDWTLDIVRRYVPPKGRVLVPGVGVGREALHLARAGFRITGIDLVQEMVDASAINAKKAGVAADFIKGDMVSVKIPGEPFDGVYVTPLVFSFVAGSETRIACLRNLGRHMSQNGALVFSAYLIPSVRQFLRLAIVHARRKTKPRNSGEFGDWFTWFLTPHGDIGKAFTHHFLRGGPSREAKEAGFSVVSYLGHDHFLAREFRT
jgi:hypothetical protein